MLSRITAIIMAIVSIISGFGVQLTRESEILYDVEYGKYTRQTLDVIFPAEFEKDQGVILFIHGGGWISGSKSGFTSKAITFGEKYNCITASMNYRYTSDKVDCADMLSDISKALGKIKSLAKTRGINANKVMLVGYSAGAHLALLYSYTQADKAPIKPAAVVSYSGPTDLTGEKFVERNALVDADSMMSILSKLIGEKVTESNFNKKKSKILSISPVSYVSPFCVPTLVVQGKKDGAVPVADTRTFVNKLEAMGATYEYFELKHSGHRLSDDPAVLEKSNEALASYVEQYLN